MSRAGKKERGLSSPWKSLLEGWNTGGRTFLSANKKFMTGWKTRPPLRETGMTDKALKKILEKIGV